MNPRRFVSPFCFSCLLAVAAAGHRFAAGQEGPRYCFENLGKPLQGRSVGIRAVTRDADGRYTAWATITKVPGQQGLVGVDVETGETLRIPLARFGSSHIRITRAENGHLYLYSGKPAHFLKVNANSHELSDLGVPADDGYYFLSHAIGPDGKFYVGSYPATRLVCVDPATDEIEDCGRMAEDPKEKYIIRTAVSDDNVVYCTVGLHHAELWAWDAKTRTKRQILPEELTGRQGTVGRIWVGTDGEVYARCSGKAFRCLPDRVEYVEEVVPRRGSPPLNRAGDYLALRIMTNGKLVLKHAASGETRMVQSDFEPFAAGIYCVACEHDGKIYGGGRSGFAHLFSFDPDSGAMEDLGRQGGGRVQVYDVLSHPKGLFLSSYTGCSLDLYDPTTKKKTPIVTLSKTHQQERARQLTLGPDGMIYTGTVPVKGIVGGAVVRLNPADLSVKVWRNVIENQSFTSAVAVPRTGEMFFTSSIQGGTSAIPSEKEAFVMLWDTEREKTVWKGQPIPGTTHYGYAAMGSNGLIYGLAGRQYYVFDPMERNVVKTGEMPVRGYHFPAMADGPAGPSGLIYGLADDAIYAFDPADHGVRVIARHESIKRAHGMFVTGDGALYYGADAELWRVDLNL